MKKAQSLICRLGINNSVGMTGGFLTIRLSIALRAVLILRPKLFFFSILTKHGHVGQNYNSAQKNQRMIDRDTSRQPENKK
jgi:hypothetical protein